MTLSSVEHFLTELGYTVKLLTEPVGIFSGVKYECSSCCVSDYRELLSLIKELKSKEIWLYRVLVQRPIDSDVEREDKYLIRYCRGMM